MKNKIIEIIQGYDTSVRLDRAQIMADEILGILDQFLYAEASECSFEQHKAGFAIMVDRSLLKEYWKGKEAGFKSVKTFIDSK